MNNSNIQINTVRNSQYRREYSARPLIFDKGKGIFYIAQYLVRWTTQSDLDFLPSLTDLFIPTPLSYRSIDNFETV